MKNSTYLIVLLALGLVFVSYKWISTPTVAPTPESQNTTLSDIFTRTSVRSYTDQPIASEQIDTLLRAAMSAPTAVNKQPWRFIVVDDQALLDSIAHNFSSMKMAADAPVAIIACGDLSAALEGAAQDYWIQDVSAATENLLLAAHSMGLGAVWCGIYPIADRVDQFSDMLQLPSDIIPLACICIGHPLGENTPKDKWHPEYIHHNTW